MADGKGARTGGGFWRCDNCGTPNPERAYVTNCLGCGQSRRVSGGVVLTQTEGETGRGRYLLGISWAYAVLMVVLLSLIQWVGDGWWGVTVLLFAPRWIFLGPVLLLVVASGLRRCWWHWGVQGAAALVVLGPIMGVSLPLKQLWEGRAAGERVRIATYNLGIAPIEMGALKAWVDRLSIDILCIQEGGRDDRAMAEFAAAGWSFSRKRHVASRFPIVEEFPEFEAKWEAEERFSTMLERVKVRTPRGKEFVVASVHLPTLRPGLVRLMNRGDVAGLELHKDWWGRETARMLAALAETRESPILIGGDFNMPSDDSTMSALKANYQFGFEQAGWGYGYTRPTRLPWIRIDHILASQDWSVRSCQVGPDFGSDHLPSWCEAVLMETSGR